MQRLTPNILGAGIVAAAAAFYLSEARRLPFGGAHEPDVGFVPNIVAVLVLGLCAVVVVKDLWRRPAGTKPILAEGRKYGQAGAVAAALVFYPLAIKWLGFPLTTLLTMLAVFRAVDYRGWAGSLLLALAMMAVAWFVFGWWMGVYLPRGAIFG